MKGYINGMGCISPGNAFGSPGLEGNPSSLKGQRLSSLEPDYGAWIDPKTIRRMSRIIRMGVTSSALALREAGLQKPDAIVTGTAFGCLEDTGTFLSQMIVQDEQALNPTPFIQSTHNTIGSQIALLLQCYGYNQTYVHRAFSFEQALLDATMLLEEEQARHVLVGGIDELTDISYALLERFGWTRSGRVGEGSVYLALSHEKSATSYARLLEVSMRFQPDNEKDITDWLFDNLQKHSLTLQDIDLALVGTSPGHLSVASMFRDACPLLHFKDYCGEYPTASAFALWAGASALKGKAYPPGVQGTLRPYPEKVLVYNSFFGTHHALMLLESC